MFCSLMLCLRYSHGQKFVLESHCALAQSYHHPKQFVIYKSKMRRVQGDLRGATACFSYRKFP